jgi:transcriptional regulator with XRE-family HTH domain
MQANSPFKGLGHALRELREERGLTLEEAGERAQVSTSNLSRYERDATEPTLRVLGRLLSAYQVDAAAFFERVEKPGVAEPKASSDGRGGVGGADDPFLEAVRGALKRLGYGAPDKDAADRAKES